MTHESLCDMFLSHLSHDSCMKLEINRPPQIFPPRPRSPPAPDSPRPRFTPSPDSPPAQKILTFCAGCESVSAHSYLVCHRCAEVFNATWHLATPCVCDMTYSMCDVTPSCMCDLFNVCVTWLIYLSDTTHTYDAALGDALCV